MIAEISCSGNIADVAKRYIERGYAPIPVPSRSKAPSQPGWQRMRLTVADVPKSFNGAKPNIGLLCGEPSNGLADVDCDACEAIQTAKAFLPTTNMRHGRTGKPDSHYWYLTTPIPPQTIRYKDTDGTTLIELRSTGGQTLVPPSVHPCGEPLVWEADGEPGLVGSDVLQDAVASIAAASLIARHWPDGSRHDTALALAGTLLRHGWTEEEAVRFVRVVCECAGDEETHARLKNVSTTRERLVTGRKATGIPTLRRLLGDEVVGRIVEWLHITECNEADLVGSSGGADTWIPTADPWPAPLVEAAYYGLAGEIIRAIEPQSEADPVAILVQLLVLVGNCIGRTPYFAVEADRHHTNLNVVTVGETSGGRKGVALNRARQPLALVDGAWEAQRVKGGLSSAEGLIWQVRDAIYKWEKGKDGGDPVAVMTDPGATDKRFVATETEFASVLRQFQRDGNTLSNLIRDAFDRGTLETLVKNNPAKATGAHISIIGHITKDELLRYLDSTEAANGLGNRIAWLCVRRSKDLPDGGETIDLTPFTRRLDDALHTARTIGEMHRDEEARALWHREYGRLTEGRAGLLGAMVARAAPIVLRLSMIYALLDGSAVIRVPHLQAALAIWEFAEASARWIFGDTLGDPVADEILRALRAAPGGLTRTDIYSGLFGRNQSAARIGRALASLLEKGLTRWEREDTGGRPGERWFAVRRGGA